MCQVATCFRSNIIYLISSFIHDRLMKRHISARY